MKKINLEEFVHSLNVRKVVELLLLCLIIICVIVIISNFTKPISYGVSYTLRGQNGTVQKYIFYRNQTYKSMSYDGEYTNNSYGTYSISITKHKSDKGKWVYLDNGQSFSINSLTKISSGNNEYKSTLSDGIITCSIFAILSAIILLSMKIKDRKTTFK